MCLNCIQLFRAIFSNLAWSQSNLIFIALCREHTVHTYIPKGTIFFGVLDNCEINFELELVHHFPISCSFRLKCLQLKVMYFLESNYITKQNLLWPFFSKIPLFATTNKNVYLLNCENAVLFGCTIHNNAHSYEALALLF